ncbi:MAG: serine/threonine protein kinase, partial [Planctomycetes bacterium]|nr:serine/threonine protein kinase [Planctomycetota bacterium]
MTADWKQVRAMFEAACEVPEPDRTAWLDRHVLDGEVRAAVERLLRNVAPATFLEPPGAATLGVRVAPVFPPGQRLGPFLLGPVLGQGGMGVVYAAEQERPRRTVAVKVMRSPIDDPRARVRFEAEIEALARLQHPGIAQVHEAGIEPDGTCWFAMELLRDSRPLNAFEWPIGSGLDHRLATFARICDAVQHAHQRGVIHRDLKPANILVLPDGAIRVIDFGIARLRRADDATLTEAGQLLGTLAYMSPEQAAGGDIDVRTDVYGLGCVLYELLTGRRPFDLDGVPLTTACRVIAEQDPRPPSTLAAGLPREIDWILGQALRKEPRERYAGVAELAADIGRLLADEPVHAAPP